MTMDTAADLSGSVGYVPLVYLARFSGSRWLGTGQQDGLSDRQCRPDCGRHQQYSGYTDMTFYGQDWFRWRSHRPRVDVSGVTAQSTHPWRIGGTLSPDFGRIEIAGVSVQGQTVTLSIAGKTLEPLQ